MAACDKLNFTGVSAAPGSSARTRCASAWRRDRAGQRERGGAGFTVAWSYAGRRRRWSCSTDHPFLVPCALVNGQITSLVESILHPA